MIVDSITGEFDGFEWWYAFALSLAFSAAVAGLAYSTFVFLRTRSWTEALAPALLTAVGVATAALATLAAVDRSPLTSIPLQMNLFASNVLSAVILGLALVLGVAGAAVTVAALALWRPQRSRAGTALRTVTPALVVALGVAVPLAVIEAQTADRVPGAHPVGTVLGGEFPATQLARGLALPTGMAVSSSGDVFFTELATGRIGVVTTGPENAGREVRWVATIPLPEGGKLFHIALHPDWPDSPYLYVTAEHEVDDTRYLRLIRVRSVGDGQPELQPLIELLPIEQPMNSDHYGSAIAFCAGYLFLSIGDTDGPGPRRDDSRRYAQIPSMAEGKVLRYRLDGTDLTPAGVVYDDPPVFAMGFRNVFGLTCDLETNLPVVVDNGSVGHDQVRVVGPASNHEWPFTAERDRLTPPLYDSGPTPLGPTGIVVREVNDNREILFSAFHSSSVYRLRSDAGSNEGPLPELFHSTPSGALALTQDEDGCVYVADVTSIWRIRDDYCSRTDDGGNDGVADAAHLGAKPVSEFYGANCAVCHGADRGGVPDLGPSLQELDLTDDFYFETIADGRQGTLMPSWRAAGLSDDEIRAIVDWLKAAEP
jgi:glucose/arabinose dehydrogenase/cytochrome c5